MFHVGRQTDRHDESNIRFSRFCERVLKLSGYLKSVCTGKTVPGNGHEQTNVSSHTAMVKVD